jgi:pyruvate ferredoxin oxidoreductase beta subunit
MSEAFQKAGKKTNVIVYAGDGGTVDIGLQALSGAFERETDFLYICYDNEAYGNTGMQRSGSTPIGARTTTTPGGKVHAKKDLDAIVAAHNPSYLATACAAYPQDLFKKVQKALTLRGSKFIHVLAPCPPGWRFSSEMTVESEFGKVTINGPSKAAMIKPVPIEDYLSVQGRFKGIDRKAIDALKSQAEQRAKHLQKEAEGIC